MSLTRQNIVNMNLSAFLTLCLPLLCKAIDNGLNDVDNVEIDPLNKLVLNTGQ